MGKEIARLDLKKSQETRDQKQIKVERKFVLWGSTASDERSCNQVVHG